MKKRYLLLVLILMALVPTRIYALNASVNMACNGSGLFSDKTVECTISATTDSAVSGFHGVLSFSDDIEITSFNLDNRFIVFDDIVTDTSPITLDLITKIASNLGDLQGDFTIATFEAKVKSNSISTSQELVLDSIQFFDDNVNQVDVAGSKAVIFTNYLTINNYLKNDTSMVIYGLNCPLTVSTFLSNVSTNSAVAITNKNNIALTETANLATGHKFTATFRDGRTTQYKFSLLGDVIGEGEVTINSAKAIARHIIDGNIISGQEYLLAADYDQNNEIKMNDVVRILKSLDH